MSVSGIIGSNDKIYNSLLPNPYPYPAFPSPLGAVLIAGNQAGDQDIVGVNNLQVAKVDNPSLGGILTIGGAGQDLRIQGATVKGSIVAGNGTSTVEIPVGANGLVLKANSATATGLEWGVDGNSGVTSVNSGNNISVDNTAPLAPIVNLQNPITNTFNFAEIALDGASNDGVIDRSQTIHIQTTGGTLAEIKESFTETSTGKSGFTTLNQGVSLGELEIKYIDSGITSSSKVQALSNLSGYTFNTIDTSDNTNHTLSVSGNGMNENIICNSTTDTSIVSLSNTLSGSAGSEQKILNKNDTTASNTYQQTLSASGSNLLLTTSDTPAQYTTTIAINSTKNSSVSCSMGATDTANNRVAFNNSQANGSTLEARTEIKCVETGATPLTSDMDLVSDSTSCRIQQTYIPNSGLYQLSTITTNSTGLDITSTNGRMFLVATGNAKLQGSGSVVDCQPTALISTSQVFQNFSSQSGSPATPNFIFKEASPTAVGACVIRMDKAVAPTTGNTISAISSYALDGTATPVEWSRIQTKVENIGVGNNDGTLSIFNSVNGTMSETFNFNGGQNENNSFRPLDMNGNNIRTTTGSLAINVASSSTAGATLTLATKDNVAGSGAGLALTGNTVTSVGAGITTGHHMCITLPDPTTGLPRVYKIALLNL